MKVRSFQETGCCVMIGVAMDTGCVVMAAGSILMRPLRVLLQADHLSGVSAYRLHQSHPGQFLVTAELWALEQCPRKPSHEMSSKTFIFH